MRNTMLRRFFASKTALAAVTAMAVSGLSTAASAHVGDHSRLTVAELANHLMSSLDHKYTIMTVVLVMAFTGASVVLAYRKR
jgi:ABC-type enterochelin transport system permease subunit